MRFSKLFLMTAALALVLAPGVGLACDGHAKAAETAQATPCGGCSKSGCPKDGAETATLAAHAEKGCEKSTAALVAKARQAGCSHSAELAAKAEAGDAEAKAALIAMYKAEQPASHAVQAKAGEPSLAELASRAEGGCAHSAAALIARAKHSKDAHTVELATRAEGGCQASKAALIAELKDGDQ